MLENRLKEARNRVGISQKEIAKQLFISQQAYAKYETGSSTPNPETLNKIANILNTSVDYLLGNSSSPDIKEKEKGVKIPVLGYVAGGVPIEAIEDIIDWEEIPESMARRGEYFGLQIKGHSMEPKICEGDIVIVRKQPDIESSEVAIVIVNGDEGTCKKVVKHSNGISLISFNPTYEPIFYTADEVNSLPVTILGKVVELRRKF